MSVFFLKNVQLVKLKCLDDKEAKRRMVCVTGDEKTRKLSKIRKTSDIGKQSLVEKGN